jgi:hypothetical protein
MGSSKQNNSKVKKDAILTFVKKNGRRPSQYISDEKSLANSMYNYLCKSSVTYDHEFFSMLEEIAPTRIRDPIAKKTAILAFVKEHGRRPSRSRPEEKQLGKSLSDYIWSQGDSYDPEFSRQLNELVPKVDTVSLNKDAILAFVKEHGRKPRYNNPEEKKLAIAVGSYTRKSKCTYDQEFSKLLNELVPKVDAASQNKEAILAFVKEHGRRPSQIKPDEKKLGIAARTYIGHTHKQFDPEFERRLNELGQFQLRKFSPSLKKKAILAFAKEHGRRPSTASGNEKNLGHAAASYVNPSSGCYDPKFRDLLNKLAPKIDTVSLNKDAILAFVKKHGRRPKASRTEEKKLSQAANRYTGRFSRSFDPDFKAKLEALLKKKK